MSSPSPTAYVPADVSKFEWLVIAGGFACFAMAWGIGANDVANWYIFLCMIHPPTSLRFKSSTLNQMQTAFVKLWNQRWSQSHYIETGSADCIHI